MSQDERVREELEALEAILMDDIAITNNEQGCAELVKCVIFPATANELEKQYVCVTLEVQIPEGYPDCVPIVRLKSPRGLDDSTIDHMYREIHKKCEEYVGQPVLFELIELIRENLNESNLPTCQCAVCLYGFCEGDAFTKTDCFHYFHDRCLATHITVTGTHFREEQDKLPAWKRTTETFQASCPVCREPIRCDVAKLETARIPKELENARTFEVSLELKRLQQKMRQLYDYQKSRGGIIDVEAEENKFLLVTEAEQQQDGIETDENFEDPGPSPQQPSPPIYNGNHLNRSHNQRYHHHSKYHSHR